jgi:hypothetical protein
MLFSFTQYYWKPPSDSYGKVRDCLSGIYCRLQKCRLWNQIWLLDFVLSRKTANFLRFHFSICKATAIILTSRGFSRNFNKWLLKGKMLPPLVPGAWLITFQRWLCKRLYSMVSKVGYTHVTWKFCNYKTRALTCIRVRSEEGRTCPGSHPDEHEAGSPWWHKD